jgi:hypothetical protein
LIETDLKLPQSMSFTWKEGGAHDVGFSAEDVAAIEPLLVTLNEKGEVADVKDGRSLRQRIQRTTETDRTTTATN